MVKTISANNAIYKVISKVLSGHSIQHEIVKYKDFDVEEIEHIEVFIQGSIIYDAMYRLIEILMDFDVKISRGREEIIFITLND